MSAVSAAILVGGHSRRMGRDKARLEIGSSTLLERVIAAATPAVDELVLIARQAGDYADFGLPVYADLHPDLGPVGGLYTALKRSPAPAVLLLPCDLPFITADFLRFLLDCLGDHHAVVPRNDESLQPLCSVYTRHCLPAIEAAIATNRLSIKALHRDIDTRILGPDEWRHLDPHRTLFANLNPPDDYERAQAMAAHQI